MTSFWLALFYNGILFAGSLLMLPGLLVQIIRGKKSLSILWERFGGGIAPIDKRNRPLVWVHAVSLGETKGVAPLVAQLQATLKDPIIVVSSITATGHAEAKSSMPFADRHLFLPLDFSFVVRRLLHKIKPDLVIVMETDYWYNFLREAHQHGAKLVVANGKLSARSADRYRRLPFFSQALFGLFDRICVQSEEYRQRFEALGVVPARLTVTGNIKFDASIPEVSPEARSLYRQRLGIKADDRLVTAGSTHDTEEKLIIRAFRDIWREFPTLKLIIVPRHPERFDDVARLLVSEGIPFRRYSDSVPSRGEIRVVLVDAMGVLKDCYQESDVAIVAGSFTSRVGGHNILEPSHYGVPVVFGPYMHAQPELERLLLDAGAGLQVKNEELASVLGSLLRDEAQCHRIGQAGQALIKANRGAIARTMQSIKK